MKTYIYISKIMVFFTIVMLKFGSFSSLAQGDSDLMGHYPLLMREVSPGVPFQRHLELHPWDVSAQSNHGTAESSSGEGPIADQDFSIGSFVTTLFDFTNVKKEADSDANIKLEKNPFEGVDINTTGFTISFWVKQGVGFPVLTDQFEFLVGSNTATFYFERSEGPTVHLTVSGFEPNEWTMMVLKFEPESRQIRGEWYDNLGDLRYSQFQTLQDDENFEPIREGSNIFEGFEGELAHVRFWKTHLSEEQVTYIAQTDRSGVLQYVRLPFSHYPLNGGGEPGKETVMGRDATSESGLSATTNRFDKAGKAIQLTGANAGLVLPSFFEVGSEDTFDPTRGYTVSFWMNMSTSISSSTDVAVPFSDDDTRYKAFYGDNSEGESLMGMQRILDRLGVLTYVNNDSDKLPWYNWLYDPTSLRSKTGWYHIVYVQEEFGTRVYLASKDEDMDCGCEPSDYVCWRTCTIHYDYYGSKSLEDVISWGIGNANGTAEEILDDFSFYRWPLQAKEVIELHAYSSLNSVEDHESLLCSASDITAYSRYTSGGVYVGWTISDSVNVNQGQDVSFGPQPISGGSWEWTGPNGYTSASREITISNVQTDDTGDYLATYTNAEGCESSTTYTIAICTPSDITAYSRYTSDGVYVGWTINDSVSVDQGQDVSFGPQPVSGGSWEWTGPNGYTSTSREITISNIQADDAGDYITTYTNPTGCVSSMTYALTITLALGEAVTLYDFCDYDQPFASLGVGSYTLSDLTDLGVNDDDISSLQIEDGFQVTLYQNDNFSGSEIVLTADTDCLSDIGFQNSASSLVIETVNPSIVGQVVTLYDFCDYEEVFATLGVGSYTQSDLEDLGINNNDISSLEVEDGYQVTLYDGSNFSGESLVRTADESCLIDFDFNQTTSSLIIEEAIPGSAVVTLYDLCDYGEVFATLGVGSYTQSDLQDLGVNNNDISSLEVEDGYQVTLYDGSNFSGESLVRTADESCLIDFDFNQTTSSLIIEEVDLTIVGSVATLYDFCNYGGYAIDLTVGSYNMADLISLGMVNDDVESITVVEGYQITIYQHSNFNGNSLTLTSDDSCLPSNFQDEMSSAVVEAISGARLSNSDEENFDVSEDMQLLVYPNPADRVINLEGIPSTQAVQIYNMVGSLIMETTDKQIDISALKGGVYWIKTEKQNPVRFIKR